MDFFGSNYRGRGLRLKSTTSVASPSENNSIVKTYEYGDGYSSKSQQWASPIAINSSDNVSGIELHSDPVQYIDPTGYSRVKEITNYGTIEYNYYP